MRWELLGRVRVIDRGRTLDFRGRRSSDVLAALVLGRGRPLSIERLVDELWPHDPPPSARNSVQRFVSDIRAGLGSERVRLHTEPAGYRLDLDECDVDLVIAENQVLAGLEREDGEGVESLRAAIGALSQPLCPASAGLAIVAAEQVRLTALRLRAIEKAASLAPALGTPPLDELEGWFREFPFNERLAASVMTALANAGRQRDALAVLSELRTRLRDELGLDPSVELNRIELEILQQKSQPLATSDPARATTAQGSVHADLLIGRDAELARIDQLLADHRLVTLTGLGGAGKTTLALHAAERIRTSTGWPVASARLEDARDAADVVETIAASIGLAPSGADRPHDLLRDEIGRFLTRVETVVVIDNAEHVLDVVAALLGETVAVPGAARVIVTSRHRLGISAEAVVLVEPLALTRESEAANASPAVQLFAARGAALPDVDRETLLCDAHARRICSLVDGLPLALELAAAQLRVFTTAELAARLEGPSHSLRTTTGGRARHSSLDQVLAGSWKLLSDDEARLLAELALYRSCTVHTVEFLAGDTGITTLQSLIDKSLVSVIEDDGHRWFTLLETVRKFAAAKLADFDEHEARHRHAGWIINQVAGRSNLECAIDAAVTTQLFAHRADVLRAIDWLRECDAVDELFELLIAAAGSFAHHGSPLAAARYYEEAIELADSLHEAGSLSDDAFGALLTSAVDVLHAAGDLERVVEIGFRAVAIGGEDTYDWLPGLLANIAVLIETAACDGSCEALLIRAEALVQGGQDDLSAAHVAMWRGLFEMVNRRYETALASFERALKLEPRPGRVLLLSESSRLICEFLLDRTDHALRHAKDMASKPATDLWHYLVDIAGAVGLGGGDPRAGARRLEATLGPTGDSDFAGYTDDVRIATGVLAWHGGDADLCRRMLDNVMGRTPTLVALLVEYVDGEPHQPMTSREWQTRWRSVIDAYFADDAAPSSSWVTNAPRELTIEHALALVGLADHR